MPMVLTMDVKCNVGSHGADRILGLAGIDSLILWGHMVNPEHLTAFLQRHPAEGKLARRIDAPPEDLGRRIAAHATHELDGRTRGARHRARR